MGETIRIALTTVAEIIGLRHRILRAGLPLETACLHGDQDESTRHLGLWGGETLLGCVSLMVAPCDGLPAMQLRGMAIAREAQGRQYGRLLLHEAEQLVAQVGFSLIWCNARETARGFYARHGWQVTSAPYFIEHAGMHVRMQKSLAAANSGGA